MSTCLIPYIPYGWQPVGQTLEIPSERSKRLNVLGLMSRRNQQISKTLASPSVQVPSCRESRGVAPAAGSPRSARSRSRPW